ncbi:DNA circularization protein [Sodalis sp. C49]|uniref:DNA circularization protein n=1 Tax=Sodalis sp. C49 TaxID=3228929 RepID=UPI003965C29F
MSIVSSAISSLLGSSGDSWQWRENLFPASFRGVPFAVVAGQGTFGRRQAVHEYPYRDTPWVEDMGRSTRRLTLHGFIVQSSLLYSAADVMKQRDSLIAACETGGSGTLIHPTLGELTVSIPEGGLKISEGIGGRVFEFSLTVIESGLKVFALTDAASAASTVSTSWLALATTTAARFIAEVKGDLRSVTQAMKTLKSIGAFWVNMIKDTADEATNLNNTLKSTFGSTRYGRYNHGAIGGSVSGTNGEIITAPDTENYSELVATNIATSVQNRAAIDAATAALLASTTVESFSINVYQVVVAINKGVPSLGDLIRVWETLAGFRDPLYRPAITNSKIAAAAQYYFLSLAGGAMVNAAAQYAPASYDEAMGILARVIAVIDNATLIIGDAGYDDVYRDLQALRKSLVSTLQNNGADLAKIKPIRLNRPMPALYAAYRFYQNAAGAESLVKIADPIHPAFMPTTFKVLAS